MRALVLLAAMTVVGAPMAQAPAAPESPFVSLDEGESATCTTSQGCLAMAKGTFHLLMRRAYDSGAQQCGSWQRQSL